jgi:hypothetical protein
MSRQETVSELESGGGRSGHFEKEIEAVRKILLPFELYDCDAAACEEQCVAALPGCYGHFRV